MEERTESALVDNWFPGHRLYPAQFRCPSPFQLLIRFLHLNQARRRQCQHRQYPLQLPALQFLMRVLVARLVEESVPFVEVAELALEE